MKEELASYIIKNSKGNNQRRRKLGIELFCDIETFTSNREYTHATEQQSWTFSLAISWWKDKRQTTPEYCIFNNFIEFFNFLDTLSIEDESFINLWFHNGNKYDNHFLEYELKEYLGFEVVSEYNKNASKECKKHMHRVSKDHPDKIIYETRIKSGNNLSMKIYYKNFVLTTVDSWAKTNESLAKGAERLVSRKLMSPEYLKTTFDYKKYDIQHEITKEEALLHAKKAFSCLTADERIYIRNDVIILAYLVKYYSECYNGFDISKMTFTQNVKEMYAEYNTLAKFQLLKLYGKKGHLKYSSYKFFDTTAMTYFKRFYKGGLNLYNDRYVGKIIYNKGFSIDENSAYPTVMYNEKLPIYLKEHSEGDSIKKVVFPNDTFEFYVMSYEDMNKHVLTKIQSHVLRTAIVKYYNSINGFCYINSALFELLHWLGIDILEIPVKAYSVFKTEYFGARDVIKENYYIKQGCSLAKSNTFFTESLETFDPSNITTRPFKEGDRVFQPEEKEASKVLLNGIYGVPALRPFYNMFIYEDKQLLSFPNSFENKERNIVFSAGVTAFAFRNLLGGLRGLSQSEIDEYFLYCDTDSLYLLEGARDKLTCQFDPNNLGAWDEEHNFSAFYPFNHKKYCLLEDDEIVVRCGGVSSNTISQWLDESKGDIEYFVNHFFKDGTKIISTRNVRNKNLTVSIYEGVSELKQGTSYFENYSKQLEEEREALIEYARKLESISNKEAIYYESNHITLGSNDLVPDQVPSKYSLHPYDLIKDFEKIEKYLKK